MPHSGVPQMHTKLALLCNPPHQKDNRRQPSTSAPQSACKTAGPDPPSAHPGCRQAKSSQAITWAVALRYMPQPALLQCWDAACIHVGHGSMRQAGW